MDGPGQASGFGFIHGLYGEEEAYARYEAVTGALPRYLPFLAFLASVHLARDGAASHPRRPWAVFMECSCRFLHRAALGAVRPSVQMRRDKKS